MGRASRRLEPHDTDKGLGWRLVWGFEVEQIQLQRIIAHYKPKSPGGRRRKRVTCVANRSQESATCLIGSNYRFDAVDIPHQHRHYINRVFRIPHACSDLAWLAKSDVLLNLLRRPKAILRISGFPKSLESAAETLLFAAGVICEEQLSPTLATHVLSICHWADWSPLFFYGIYEVQGVNPMSGVPAPPPMNPPPVSRAYWKMHELWNDFILPRGILPPEWAGRDWKKCKAVDVGSAPGGWSHFLSGVVSRVVPIDAAALAPEVASLPNVRHVQYSIAQPETAEALAEEAPFDIVCSDINTAPWDAAQLLRRHVLPHCRVGALLILTLKLLRAPRPGNIEWLRGLVMKDIELQEGSVEVVWLHANSVNERTLFGRVLGPGKGGWVVKEKE